MKSAKKKLSPITITVLALAVIGVVVSAFLIAHHNNTEKPGIETTPPIGDLQDYEFPDFEPIWGQVAFPGEYNKEKDVLVDYAYSDKYFEIDSTIYNPSLSTMSLCLELSAWASYETDVWAEKTKNARKLLDEIGFEDFAQNDFWSASPSTESIGVVAAHKELADSTLIALPVRGGKYYNEWGSNVNVGSTGEHTGFAEGRDNVIKFLEDYIVAHDITGRVKIWVVGYSRGGAVANLVAGYLNENELPNGATLAFEDLYCYAFEPPQGSIVELAGSDADHANIHNIVNPNDLVTMVAPVDWEFTRYNSTSRLLPTITTAEFESALAVMLEEYKEILAGVELPDPTAAIYNVSEFAKRIDVNVNPLNFLPGGDPMVDIQIVDDTSQTMNEVLTRFITAFAGSLDGRNEYTASLEADLIHLLDQLMGYETGFEMDVILTSVMEVMTADGGENLKYVLAPIFALNSNSAEERTNEVVFRLHEVLPQPDGFTDLYSTAATLIKAVGNLLVNYPEELLDIALAFTNSKVMQSHYEEITLAWVRAGDPHYTDTPYTMAVPETLRTVRVNCPVNVEIYDSEGNLVASMIDKVATTTNAVVGCAMNEDGEIIIHLPADAEYNIVTTATGDGEVNVTLSEYNLVHSKVTRVQNYTDIPVVVGDVLTLTAPDLVEEEYTDEEHQGSTAEYHLSDNSGEEILCQRESRGSDIKYFDVSVHTNNTFGTVNGGGQYLDGTFAMVEAQPVAGGEFIGWYAHGKLVPTDSAYRFAVDENTSLTAHFSEVSLYNLTFGTSDGGTVANTDHAYTVGSRVQLSAEANEGYEFDHWEATAGTVENASDAQTVFIVSDRDAAITAVFKIKLCPVCHEALASGETHAASCGVKDHYSCDGDDHNTLNCGHFACADGEHESLVCGHYVCQGGSHQTLSCGHYACGSDEHDALPCGHYACEDGEHQSLACGHFNCDSGNHGTLDCGHYACESGDHKALNCGHYSCSSGEHGELSCGHYACESGEHQELPCGHFACESGEHGALACGHYSCDNGEHGELPCGHFTCDSGSHDQLSCGHYSCDDGNHGNLSCGHYACDSGDHNELSCGHYSCEGGNHGSLSCGHYACDSGDHGNLPCGHYGCGSGDHTTICPVTGCGKYLCDGHTHDNRCGVCQQPGAHQLECGHYSCDETVSGLNHDLQSCGHYGCVDRDHTAGTCGADGHYDCSGTHTAADCGISGHYICDTGNHAAASCGTSGHYACDGKSHGTAACQIHKLCDGDDHGAASCGNSGHFVCDDSDHTTICTVVGCGKALCDGHTHANVCEKCRTENASHELVCGHYSCEVDASAHGAADCGTDRHYKCDSKDHSKAACGTHYVCDGSEHGAADCETPGHYVCDKADHSATMLCGHVACSTGDHSAASCGNANHYMCDGTEHRTAACQTHNLCDGGAHGAASCGYSGHYVCDNSDHTTICSVVSCGKALCDGHTHTDVCEKCQTENASHELVCGHFSCEVDASAHGAADCGTDGHYKCDGENHQEIGCGHRYCSEDGNSQLHFTAMTCGLHRGCYDGEHTDHSICAGCNSPLCNGQEHGAAGCNGDGHYICDGGDHTVFIETGRGNCGHYKCDQSAANLTHALIAECSSHFRCDASAASLDHSYCSDCNHSLCSDELPDGIVHGTGEGGCHQWAYYTCHGPCGEVLDDGGAHYMPCGHYSCDSSVAQSDHSVMGCRVHYNCDPDVSAAVEHATCEYCNYGICNGEDHTTMLACGCCICETYYPYEPHDAAECGTTGHYVCDDFDHSVCTYCGRRKCEDETEHGEDTCNSGT